LPEATVTARRQVRDTRDDRPGQRRATMLACNESTVHLTRALWIGSIPHGTGPLDRLALPRWSGVLDASWRGSVGLSGPHSALEALIGILICRRDRQLLSDHVSVVDPQNGVPYSFFIAPMILSSCSSMSSSITARICLHASARTAAQPVAQSPAHTRASRCRRGSRRSGRSRGCT